MHNQEIYDLEQDLEKIYMSSGLGQGGVTLQKQAWTSLHKFGQPRNLWFGTWIRKNVYVLSSV